jgi:hypothetical protein
LTFEAVSGAFVVWALMLVMGIVGFAAELIYAHASNKETKEKNGTRTGRTRMLHIEYTDDCRLDDLFELIEKYKELEMIRIVNSNLYVNLNGVK